MNLNSDNIRSEDERQTQELSDLISQAIKQHTDRTAQPILNSVVGALASHIGRALGHLDARERKQMRDAVVRAIKTSEKVNKPNPNTKIVPVRIHPKH